MTLSSAAAWIAPDDEVDRGNLLGAATATAQRETRELGAIIEGTGELEAALAAARETGLLIIPESGQVLPGAAEELALLERARREGWRLLLLSLGADSTSCSGELVERLFRRLAATPDSCEAPLPPAALRRRVAAGTESMFRRSGRMHVECFETCLLEAGASLAASASVLDWGAGCGRMTAHLTARAPHAFIVAADTDAEAIAWVGEHLEVGAARVLPLRPPTTLQDDAFDTVIGHSVFSHLDIDAQDQWLQELSRITQRGGLLALSFNGPVALRWHREHPLIDLPDSIEDDLLRDGIAIWREDGWEKEFYEGYHTTFHRHDYIRDHWSACGVEVIAVHEAAALPTQDIAVLRSR